MSKNSKNYKKAFQLRKSNMEGAKEENREDSRTFQMISIDDGSELKNKQSGSELDLDNIETRHGDFGLNSVVL